MQLTELNKKLYKVFEEVQDGKIEVAQARALVGVSQAINENCRLQLDTVKEVGGKIGLGYMAEEELRLPPVGVSVEKTAETPVILSYATKDTYAKKTEFANSLGFKGVVEAIGFHGKNKFNKLFEESLV